MDDNRATVAMQRRLAAMSQGSGPVQRLQGLSALAEQSGRAVQLRALVQPAAAAGQLLKRPAVKDGVAQLEKFVADRADAGGQKSEVEHTSGTLKYRDGDAEKYAEVGVQMNATLYPGSPMRGQAVGPQWTWMDDLKRRANTTVIRAHLLNHDLGGKAMPYNLYPLSNAANKQHSVHVEQKVKSLLFADEPSIEADGKPSPVKYNVKVEDRTEDGLRAAFKCDWEGKKGKGDVTILSDLRKDKGFSTKKKTLVGETHAAEDFKVLPDWAKSPGARGNAMPGKTINGIQTEAVEEGSTFKRTARWKKMLGIWKEELRDPIVNALAAYLSDDESADKGEIEGKIEVLIWHYVGIELESRSRALEARKAEAALAPEEKSAEGATKSKRKHEKGVVAKPKFHKGSDEKMGDVDDEYEESDSVTPEELAIISGMIKSDERVKRNISRKAESERLAAQCLAAVNSAIAQDFKDTSG